MFLKGPREGGVCAHAGRERRAWSVPTQSQHQLSTDTVPPCDKSRGCPALPRGPPAHVGQAWSSEYVIWGFLLANTGARAGEEVPVGLSSNKTLFTKSCRGPHSAHGEPRSASFDSKVGIPGQLLHGRRVSRRLGLRHVQPKPQLPAVNFQPWGHTRRLWAAGEVHRLALWGKSPSFVLLTIAVV